MPKFCLLPLKTAPRDPAGNEARAAYITTGTTTLIVNALETGLPEPSFGGALVVDAAGRLVAESPHGTDAPLIWSSDAG